MAKPTNTMTVRLCGETKNYVEEHVASGECASAEEYIAMLVKKAGTYEKALEERLLGALDSPTIEVPDDVLGKPEMMDWLEQQFRNRQISAA